MPDSPRLRLTLHLTEPEIARLEERAAADRRPIGQYIATLIAADLRQKRRTHTLPPLEGERYCYDLALPLKLVSRKAVEQRAAKEMRSLSQYVTRVVVAALAR